MNFHPYDILHAQTSERFDHCYKFRSMDVETHQEFTLQVSKPALYELLESAEKSFSALSKDIQDAFVNPNASPFDQLDQKMAFINEIAPEFLSKIKSPFIQDVVDKSCKNSKSSRRYIGLPDNNDGYKIEEYETPKPSLLSLLKAAKNIKGVHAAALANEQMHHESFKSEMKKGDIYQARVNGYINKKTDIHICSVKNSKQLKNLSPGMSGP